MLGEFDFEAESNVTSAITGHGEAVTLVMERAGYFHGVCVWFNSVLAQDIVTGNNPEAGDKTKNRMQAFFPTSVPMKVKKGEQIKVEFQVLRDVRVWRTRFTFVSSSGKLTEQHQTNFQGLDFYDVNS